MRILIVAGQHGDEPLARQGTERFLSRTAGQLADELGVAVAIIADINPDGAATNGRRNHRGIDLNRDHQSLSSAETRTLHRFVRDWAPDVIVDVHTFPPRRKVLLAKGLVYTHDLLIDRPTNPAIGIRRLALAEKMLNSVIDSLSNQRYLVDRYTLFRKDGRIRHSTLDVVDARNSLALRNDAFTLLLEARQPTPFDPPARREHVRKAIVAALETIVRWSANNREVLHSARSQPEFGTEVMIRSEYVAASQSREMWFEDEDGNRKRIALPQEDFSPEIRALGTIRLPLGYAVPRELASLLELLDRHGFPAMEPNGPLHVESHRIVDVKPSPRSNWPPLKLDLECYRQTIDGTAFVLFPVAHPGGRALAVFLEPASKFGLCRFDKWGLKPIAGDDFPVHRVVGRGL